MSQRIVGFSAPVRPAEKTHPTLPVGVRKEMTDDPHAGAATSAKEAAVAALAMLRFEDMAERLRDASARAAKRSLGALDHVVAR